MADPFLATFYLELEHLTSPEAKSAYFAKVAGDEIDRATAENAKALGRQPPPQVTVDGRVGAPLASVRPDGVIVAEFDLMGDVLDWIGAQLLIASPYRTGRFERSFVMLVDGVAHDLGEPVPAGAEVTFLNTQPYARRIENGWSPQSPDGVFDVVATMAARRFGNQAKIGFTFRSAILPYVPGGKNRAERAALKSQPARQSAMRMERETRTPAIVVRPL